MGEDDEEEDDDKEDSCFAFYLAVNASINPDILAVLLVHDDPNSNTLYGFYDGDVLYDDPPYVLSYSTFNFNNFLYYNLQFSFD